MKAFLVILNAVVNIFKRTFLAYKYKIIDYKCLTPLATIFQLPVVVSLERFFI
jgi:hypothetical protein